MLLEVTGPRSVSRYLPEAAEEFVKRIVLGKLGHDRAAGFLGDVDANHCRALLLVELGKVGQAFSHLRGYGGGEPEDADQRAERCPDA